MDIEVWEDQDDAIVIYSSAPTMLLAIEALLMRPEIANAVIVDLTASFVADDGPHYEGRMTVAGYSS